MRLLLMLFMIGIIGLTCGPKVTETAAPGDTGITLAGQVVYLDSQQTGAPNVWVVYGTRLTDSTDSARLDSAFTDTSGMFRIEGAAKGELFWEVYREPRRECWGSQGSMSTLVHQTNLRWIYIHRPGCENVWEDTTGDYK